MDLVEPKFDDPPVVETILEVQFPEIPGFRSVHFGLYWELIRSKYTRSLDKPRLPEKTERFPRIVGIRLPDIRFGETATPNRVWFESGDDDTLIQLQPDKFLLNWRQKGEEVYPTYEEISRRFFQEFERFCGFCEQQKLERPKPNLCEVGYINHIQPRADETAVQLFYSVFSGLNWDASNKWNPALDAVSFKRVYVIDDEMGRLYTEGAIAIHHEGKQKQEFVALRMTGRVNHSESDRTVVESMQLAHDWVVNGFVNVTNPEIQRDRWRRTQ